MSLHQRHIFYDMDMLDYFIKQIGQDRLQKFSEPYILGELRETLYLSLCISDVITWPDIMLWVRALLSNLVISI